MNSLKERQWQLGEATIIETARELLVQKGYAETSMDDIAAHLGTGEATLYLHFKSKEELALRIISHEINSSAAVLHLFDPTLHVAQRFQLLLRNGIQRRINLGEARIERLPKEIFSHPDFVAAQQRAALASMNLIEEGKKQGDIRQDIPTLIIPHYIKAIFSADYTRLLETEGITLEIFTDHIESSVEHYEE
ncbi:MAG: TetR/AcrR family transcriptional regulator [Anaerolineae bacterium]|nr:TetR/AcrR family transcriptional regulator [Anaerolineae bacterium]